MQFYWKSLTYNLGKSYFKIRVRSSFMTWKIYIVWWENLQVGTMWALRTMGADVWDNYVEECVAQYKYLRVMYIVQPILLYFGTLFILI